MANGDHPLIRVGNPDVHVTARSKVIRTPRTTSARSHTGVGLPQPRMRREGVNRPNQHHQRDAWGRCPRVRGSSGVWRRRRRKCSDTHTPKTTTGTLGSSSAGADATRRQRRPSRIIGERQRGAQGRRPPGAADNLALLTSREDTVQVWILAGRSLLPSCALPHDCPRFGP